MKKKSLSENWEHPRDEIRVGIECLSVLGNSNIYRKVDTSRCSKRLSNNHVAVATEFECSQNMVDRLSCCLKKISTAIVLNFSIVNLIFAIIDHGGIIMNKKIEISDQTDELIRKIGKIGETYDNVIRRGFGYLNSDSNFWNLE